MCRIKNLAILLGLCMVITACGSSEQQRGGVCGCEEPGTTARNGGGNGACR